MKGIVCEIASVAIFAISAAAQPAITGFQNNYSYIRPGLPNYGVAPGSIFVMYGRNMGPAAIATQGFPLAKTLSNVTINVTASDGKTYQAIPYYVSASQSAAILPSGTPAGNATVTVTYNGTPSAASQMTVIKAGFGILALNGAGSGQAAAFDVRNQYVGFANAANPGETITLWGTGLGAAPGDETQYANAGAGVDLKTTSGITAWIGGKSATVQYAGRSAYPGLDQVNVVVPSGVTGCYVSVVIQAGTVVSNSATIPVAASGRTCTDANGFATADWTALLNKAGPVTVGMIDVGRTVNQTAGLSIPGVPSTPTTTKTDTAIAAFLRYTPLQLQASSGMFTQTSFGSCTVTTVVGTSSVATDPMQPVFLDAGAGITMTAPTQTLTLAKNSSLGVNFYTLPISSTSPSFIPDTGGTFSFNNGSGGADVKGFNTSITLASPLTWTNMDATTTVDRSAGVTVNWSGGDPNSYVEISGTSSYFANVSGITPDPTSAVVVSYTCTAQVSAKTFTVPPPVLLALPPSGSISLGGITIPFQGEMSVANYTNPVKFTAAGLDAAFVTAYFSNGKSVTYK